MMRVRLALLLFALVLNAGAQTGGNDTAAADGTEADIAEIKLLLARAQRERVRHMLEGELARLEGMAAITMPAAAPADAADSLCAGGSKEDVDELPHLGMTRDDAFAQKLRLLEQSSSKVMCPQCSLSL